MSFARAVALLLCAALGSGCLRVRVLPPPPAPEPIAPPVAALRGEMPAPAPGEGVVVIGLEPQEGSALEVVGTTLGSNPRVVTRPLCDTPCAVALPIGKHVLTFQVKGPPALSGVADLQVSRRPRLLRHHLGTAEPFTPVGAAGVVGMVLGGLALVFTPIELLAKDDTPQLRSEKYTIMGGMAATGAALFGLGWLLVYLGLGGTQEGSTSVTALPPDYLPSPP
jgi:hypothetical protein